MRKINILGTAYTIEYKEYEEDTKFKDNGWAAYICEQSKKIVIGKMSTFPDNQEESEYVCQEAEKGNLRHELIHAFLSESGLSSNSSQFEGPWALNEEMVDWFAMQSIKIFDVFEKLGIYGRE